MTISCALFRGVLTGRRSLGTFVLLAVTACSATDFVDTKLPSTVSDPAVLNSPEGALNRYKGAVFQFGTATTGFNGSAAYFVTSGMLSDELTSGQYNRAGNSDYLPLSYIDSRNATPNDAANVGVADLVRATWSALSNARIRSQDAIGALAAYNPSAPKSFTGQLHAIQGMAEVMLAELYCSGIPLSTLNFAGGTTLATGSTTQQVFEHAIAEFDSAITIAADSARIVNFARVGKGRALLNLGRYEEAAEAVAAVPTTYAYKNFHSTSAGNSVGVPNFLHNPFGQTLAQVYGTVAEREGGNGLNYRTSNDPRTETIKSATADPDYDRDTLYAPAKWATGTDIGSNPITVADGIEARLIEAEAALQANDVNGWAQTLNTLRATAGSSPIPALTADSTTGASEALRVTVMFRERAFWLFMTGHRQGDMRRLIRQYGRSRDVVYPVGTYPAGPIGLYGNAVVLPAPTAELLNNPKYTGCIDTNA